MVCVLSEQFTRKTDERTSYHFTFLLIVQSALSILTITIFPKIPRLLYKRREEGKNTKMKETFQCHYCDIFFRYKRKFLKRIKHCSGRPGFVYAFQNDQVECYKSTRN